MSSSNNNMPQSLKLPPIHKLVSDVALTSEVLGSLVNESRPEDGGNPPYVKGQLSPDSLGLQGTAKKRVTSGMQADNEGKPVNSGASAGAGAGPDSKLTGTPDDDDDKAAKEASDDTNTERSSENACPGDNCRSGSLSSTQSTRTPSSSASISSASSDADAQLLPQESGETRADEKSGFGRAAAAASAGTDKSRKGPMVAAYTPSESDSSSESPDPEKKSDTSESSTSESSTSAEPASTQAATKPQTLSLPGPLEPSLIRKNDVRIPVYSFMGMNTNGGVPLLPHVPPKRIAGQSEGARPQHLSTTSVPLAENYQQPQPQLQPQQQQQQQQQQLLPRLMHEQSRSSQPVSDSSMVPLNGTLLNAQVSPSSQIQGSQGSLPQPAVAARFYHPYTSPTGLPQYQTLHQQQQQPPQHLKTQQSEYTPVPSFYRPGQQLLYYAPPRGVDTQMMPVISGAMQSNSGIAFIDPAKQAGLMAGPGQGSRQQYNSSHPEFHIIDSATGRHLVAEAPRRRGNLPKDVTNILRRWLTSHLGNPYPTEEDKMRLVEQTGLSLVQVSNWFINARRRSIPASQRRGKNHNYSRGGDNRVDTLHDKA